MQGIWIAIILLTLGVTAWSCILINGELKKVYIKFRSVETRLDRAEMENSRNINHMLNLSKEVEDGFISTAEVFSEIRERLDKADNKRKKGAHNK